MADTKRDPDAVLDEPTPLPTSGLVASPFPSCLARLLETAGQLDRKETRAVAVERLLDVLRSLQPDCTVGVRFEDDCVDGAARTDGASGRLLAEYEQELSASWPGGSIHIAANKWRHGAPEAYGHLLEQAAHIFALVANRAAEADRITSLEQHVVQLEKLSSLGRISTGIVHELNNPLTSIIAYSDYLAKRFSDRGADPTDVDRLVRINEAANRIQRFARELIDYSRPASRLTAPLDVHTIVDRALSFCRHVLKGGDITVERSYRDVPLIDGMATPLTQVFVNLFTNAWHAMDGITGTVRVTTRHKGGSVIVAVADEGCGIAHDVLFRVFDPYFTTKPKGHGVGLGLSIVRQVVEDHGGTIRAENNEPRGTVFYIELPTAVRR